VQRRRQPDHRLAQVQLQPGVRRQLRLQARQRELAPRPRRLGLANPITVWRKSSYNPVFDDNYVYKLVSASSHLALDVWGWGTGENTAVDQYTSYNQANQHFRIIQVASSQWKIVDMNSGKAITNRNGSSANVAINSYVSQASDNWAIDDHNGHFIIRNKATNAYLHSPGSGVGALVNVTTSYSGASDTDWDLIAVDSL
jgi:hypothetical protein